MSGHDRRIRAVHGLYRTLGRHFRSRRMSAFESFANITPETTVLDVGGAAGTWELVRIRPNLVLLNITPPGGFANPATAVVADGTQLPFRDQSFDLVFSNSVIEHVGDVERQRQFAREVARVGRRFYVQTPNRWFPVEPHLMTPVVHFLPAGIRRKLLRNFTVWGLMARPTQAYVDRFVRETRLLNADDMASMFPAGQLFRERAAGLTKSLIVHGPRDAPVE